MTGQPKPDDDYCGIVAVPEDEMNEVDALVGRVARALREERVRVRRENDAALAKEGLWPDPRIQPTDEQYARAAIEALQREVERKDEFLAAIMERTPNGEWIAVQYHPDRDWSVASHPLSALHPAVDEGRHG